MEQFVEKLIINNKIMASIINSFFVSRAWVKVCLHGKRKLTTALIMIP